MKEDPVSEISRGYVAVTQAIAPKYRRYLHGIYPIAGFWHFSAFSKKTRADNLLLCNRFSKLHKVVPKEPHPDES
ncbi:hypothetical protein QUF76_14095 [Desulfobacterales bacterium HSG16]|nr:hypothetical protein [Desulfobacterales bacterium HSG16]